MRDLEVYSGPIELLDRPLLYCILHDVTGRDAGSHPDADSDAHQRLVMDCAEDAIFVSDNDGHYLFTPLAWDTSAGPGLRKMSAACESQIIWIGLGWKHGYERRALRCLPIRRSLACHVARCVQP